MSTLITGGEGFIGTRLADTVRGHLEVVDVVDRKSGTFAIDAMGKKYDDVYCLAAASAVTASDADHLNDTFEAAYWALRVPCDRFVFTSSGAIYGDSKLPISVYGACKQGAEGLVNAWAHRTGKRASILRLNNVVGPGCRGVIPDILRKLRDNPHKLEVLGDGTARKRFTYIDEVVGVLVDPPEGVHDIASEDTVSVADIVRWCIDITKTDPVIVWGKTASGWPGDMPVPGGGSYPGLLSSEAAAKRAIFDCMHEVFG